MSKPKRNSYSIQYKLAAIKRAENTSNERAARDFRVDTKQIREWKKRKEIFEQLEMSKRKRVPKGEGEFSTSEAVEDNLGWKLENRNLLAGTDNSNTGDEDLTMKCLICYEEAMCLPGTFDTEDVHPVTTVLRLFNIEENFPIIFNQVLLSLCPTCLSLIEAIESTFEELQIILEKTKHFRKKLADEIVKGYNQSISDGKENQTNFQFRTTLVKELNLSLNDDVSQFNVSNDCEENQVNFNDECPGSEQIEDSTNEKPIDEEVNQKEESQDFPFLHNENSDDTVFDMETFEEIESKRKLKISIEKMPLLPSMFKDAHIPETFVKIKTKSVKKIIEDSDSDNSDSSSPSKGEKKPKLARFDELGNAMKRKRIRKPRFPHVMYEKCRESSCPVKFRVEDGDVEMRLEAHYKKVHLGIKAAWVCKLPGCHRTFHSVTSLRSHEEHGHGEDKKSFLCESCGQGFKESHNLKSHVKTVHNERPFECRTCPKIFPTQFQLDAHEERHLGRLPYKCSVCEERFLNKRELQSHCEKTGHPVPKSSPWSEKKKIGKGSGRFRKMDLQELHCVPCNKYFSTRSSFKCHEKTHLGIFDFKCDICDFKTTNKLSLKLHQVVHSDERKFSCEICGRSYKRKGVLTEHMRKHTGERPYKCGVCSKQFTGVKNLRVHMRNCDKSLELQFECIVCGMKFTCRSTMTKHIKTKHMDLGEEEVQRILIATRKDRWDNPANPNQFKDFTSPKDLMRSSQGSEALSNEKGNERVYFHNNQGPMSPSLVQDPL